MLHVPPHPVATASIALAAFGAPSACPVPLRVSSAARCGIADDDGERAALDVAPLVPQQDGELVAAWDGHGVAQDELAAAHIVHDGPPVLCPFMLQAGPRAPVEKQPAASARAGFSSYILYE